MLEGQASGLEWRRVIDGLMVRMRGMGCVSAIQSRGWIGRIYGWIWLI